MNPFKHTSLPSPRFSEDTKKQKDFKSKQFTNKTKTFAAIYLVVVATLLVVFLVLVLVLELAAKNSASNGTEDAVAAHLVAAEVARCTTTESTHQTTIALSLRTGVSRAVLLLAGLAICVVALWILILWVGTLLWELVLGCLARILLVLLGLAVLTLLLVIRCYLL